MRNETPGPVSLDRGDAPDFNHVLERVTFKRTLVMQPGDFLIYGMSNRVYVMYHKDHKIKIRTWTTFTVDKKTACTSGHQL